MEESEKVRDEVRRLREGEKGLVKSYKLYLKTLETEIKRECRDKAASRNLPVLTRLCFASHTGKSPLASVSLKCMCDLLSSLPHFNFAENIMGVIVGRLSKRTWDSVCQFPWTQCEAWR
jgi:nucleolar complex protein 3